MPYLFGCMYCLDLSVRATGVQRLTPEGGDEPQEYLAGRCVKCGSEQFGKPTEAAVALVEKREAARKAAAEAEQARKKLTADAMARVTRHDDGPPAQ